MVNVCIQKDLFPAGESMFDILAMRMATVSGLRPCGIHCRDRQR